MSGTLDMEGGTIDYGPLQREIQKLKAQRDELLECLKDLMSCGIEFDDPRVKYVTIQVSREEIRDARAAIAKAEGGAE